MIPRSASIRYCISSILQSTFQDVCFYLLVALALADILFTLRSATKLCNTRVTMEFDQRSARLSRFSLSLLSQFFITVVLFPSFAYAQSEGDGCVAPVFPEVLQDIPRHFSLATSAPATQYYREDSGDREKLERVFTFLNSLVSIMDNRRKNGDKAACNLHRELPWVQHMSNGAKRRQLGVAKDRVVDSCPSRLDFSMDEGTEGFDSSLAQGVREMLRDAVLSMRQAVTTSRASPLNNQDLTNWTKIYPLTDWDLRRLSQQCDLETVSAYRLNSKLYLRVSVTNRPVDDFVLDFDRQVFEEWVREDFQDSLRMIQPRLVHNSSILDTRGDWEESSTLLEKWGDKLALSGRTPMYMDDNPAINEALRQNAVAIDLAEDAIAPSNIAILALPLTMNLIPVAFLAELSTIAMLAYIIFTDVFSTLPFLVKGVELIRAVDNARRETVAFYMGDEVFGEIEVWNATCRGEAKFHAIGVSFVVIAVVAIVVGVFLEVFAGRVMRRRRQKDGSSAEGPFGRAAFDTTKMSLLGSGTEKDGLERRYSIDADEIGPESDTETRPSSDGSMDRQVAEEKRWWQWGSRNASSNASVVAVKMMPSIESNIIDFDIIPRDEAFFSDEKNSEAVAQEQSNSVMNRLKRMFSFISRRENEESQRFSVGVGRDGMSSAERAARESGSDGYGYEYGEEGGDQESRRDSSMV
ncbi:hypothetical protein FGB62_302g010 [Gracilaria domingensis]|nr:hypothetical protein FGB62_302g010 [Gracilaria domingensis]